MADVTLILICILLVVLCGCMMWRVRRARSRAQVFPAGNSPANLGAEIEKRRRVRQAREELAAALNSVKISPRSEQYLVHNGDLLVIADGKVNDVCSPRGDREVFIAPALPPSVEDVRVEISEEHAEPAEDFTEHSVMDYTTEHSVAADFTEHSVATRASENLPPSENSVFYSTRSA